MPRIVVAFEVDNLVAPFVGKRHHLPSEPKVADHLHEALCTAIHEGDYRAVDWLTNHVNDISIVEEGE